MKKPRSAEKIAYDAKKYAENKRKRQVGEAETTKRLFFLTQRWVNR